MDSLTNLFISMMFSVSALVGLDTEISCLVEDQRIEIHSSLDDEDTAVALVQVFDARVDHSEAVYSAWYYMLYHSGPLFPGGSEVEIWSFDGFDHDHGELNILAQGEGRGSGEIVINMGSAGVIRTAEAKCSLRP